MSRKLSTEPKTLSITFIGGGNMARSLISGLLASGWEAPRIRVSEPVEQQRRVLAELGVIPLASNGEAVSGADIIVLAVKPQVLGEVLRGLDTLTTDQLLISIAAGVPLRALRAWTRNDQPIVRCMPNTPALLQAGVTGMYADESVTVHQRALAEQVLNAAGRTLWVPQEGHLDAVTAVSGSGPAYFFYLMEAMIDAGMGLGLDRETAMLLTLETAYGAALMARSGDPSPAELRTNVTSPGGTTARALEILDAAGVRDSISQAVTGAADRSRELAEEFGRT